MADNVPQVVTIAQLPPLEPDLLSGDDSIEITISTRADGGAGMPKRTYRTTLNAVLSIYAKRRDNPNQVTAEQVGSYTIEQIKALLEEKLGVTDIAVNSMRLDGRTRQEIVEEARQGTASNSENLAGRPATDYLLVNEFEHALVEVTKSIDELTDLITI